MKRGFKLYWISLVYRHREARWALLRAILDTVSSVLLVVGYLVVLVLHPLVVLLVFRRSEWEKVSWARVEEAWAKGGIEKAQQHRRAVLRGELP